MLNELQSELLAYIRAACALDFGDVGEDKVHHALRSFWTEEIQDFRIDEMIRHGIAPGQSKVLDLAAGCGQFVFRARQRGFESFGIEPDRWKLGFIKKKIIATNRPRYWAEAVLCAIGEDLPFQSDSFDCVTTYQTLEHVGDPQRVIREMIRVTRPGGIILVRCPDYRSTYEAHYHLPWLPMMPRKLARLYLRVLGRPVSGLDTIRYVTKPRIVRWFADCRRDGRTRLLIEDQDKQAFYARLRSRGAPSIAGLYFAIWLMMYLFRAFRREMHVNLAVRVLEKR